MMKLRQCVFVAKDLESSREELCDILGIEVAYRDPGVAKWGLVNVVCPTGRDFLEIVTPFQQGTSAGRYLERRKGDGGYMVILQVDDLAEARSRVRDAGARIVDQTDKDGAAFTHIHPKDIGGAILSLDHMDPKERWEWGGPVWRDHVRTDVSVAIVGAELQAEDPRRMATRWAAVLGRPAEQSDDGWRIDLDEGEIRFVPTRDGRGEGLGAFDVAVRNVREVHSRAEAMGLLDPDGVVILSGTRVRLVAA